MINGYRPNGHFRTYNADGLKIEGESRQCIHCQYVWTYQPGSGIERGYCTRHDGFICARPECFASQKRMLAEFPNHRFSCIAFSDYNRLRFERFLKDHNYVVKPSGIIVPVELT